MDPVSATISLTASVATLIHVANRLGEVAAKFKDFERILNILSRDVKGLLMLVDLLKKIIENVEGALDSLTVTQKNKEEHALPLFNSDVETIAEELKQLLDSFEGGKSPSRWSKWWSKRCPKRCRSVAVKSRYLLKEGEVKELTRRMGRAQFNLVTVISMASLKMHVDARASPTWASGVKDVMQQVSDLPSTVEQHITMQFNTIAKQMLREQRLRPASPARQGGPPASARCQEYMAFSNKSATSFTVSIRSLPDLFKKKRRGKRGVREEATPDQANANFSFVNDCESMIGGASITDFALDDQSSIHETNINTDVTGNAILHGSDDTATTSLPSVERLTSEDTCGLPGDGLREGRGKSPPNVGRSAWRRSTPSPPITHKTLETSPSRRPRTSSTALSASSHSCSESSASSLCSRRTRVSEASTRRQSCNFEVQRGEDTDGECVDAGTKKSDDEASEASDREPDIPVHPAPDDDPDIFALVVKVANSKTDGVPDNVDFDTFLQFLLLAHKYRLGNQTLTQAKIWVLHLKGSIPTSVDRQMIAWLWISWELGMRTEFKALSATAQKEARGRIDQDSRYKVPLPDFIPDLIQGKRLEVLSEVKSLFKSVTKSAIKSYSRIFTDGFGDYVVTPHIKILMSSLVFGYLALEGRRWLQLIGKHMDENSTPEFDGVSFSDVCRYTEAMIDLGDWGIGTISTADRMPSALSMLSSFLPFVGVGFPVVEVGLHTDRVPVSFGPSSVKKDFTSLIERLKNSDWGIDLDDESC